MTVPEEQIEQKECTRISSGPLLVQAQAWKCLSLFWVKEGITTIKELQNYVDSAIQELVILILGWLSNCNYFVFQIMVSFFIHMLLTLLNSLLQTRALMQ